VCGEVGGVPPKEFDFGNSPTQTNTLELSGRTVIQRTSAGTQGIVQSVNATNILAASFVVAKATIQYIQKLSPEFVTFVITGQYGIDGGDEDLACAGYLEALLSGQNPDRNPFTERVFKSRDARRHLDPNFPEFLKSDIDLCIKVDAFDFAMPVIKENGRHVMRAIKP
jgi:2-phosphosulfolactate phosphatase